MFRRLKKRFTKKPVLAVPDLNKKNENRSKHIRSCNERSTIYFIKCENRKWRPVTFFSKFLNKIKKNYKIYNKKILVVIRRLEN